MNIERFLSKERFLKEMCSTQISSSGDGSGPRPTYHCRRRAKYKINDKLYCHQHAGEECLEYILLTKG